MPNSLCGMNRNAINIEIGVFINIHFHMWNKNCD